MPASVEATRPARPLRRVRAAVLCTGLLLWLAGGALAPSPVAADDAAVPAPSTSSTAPALTDAAQRVENVISAARAYLGFAYRLGTEGPSTFDCSGLVYRAFADAGELARIGGQRLRAAGYMRWFAKLGRLVADESLAERGDLVIYAGGAHIGIYLGDGRVLSALTTGVTVHSLGGITLAPTAFLKVDWSGAGDTPGDAAPSDPADELEVPASLASPLSWAPALPDPPAPPTGVERTDMRTASSRTYEQDDGTFVTEFYSHPIFYRPPDSTDWQPIDTHLAPTDQAGVFQTSASPATLTLGATDAASGFADLTAGELRITVGGPSVNGRSVRTSAPLVGADGSYADYFDALPGGIGLRVVPRPDGFKSYLVLPREPKSNSFTFFVDAPGLTLTLEEDGSVAFRDGAGEVVGRMPQPLLLDSSDDDGAGGGLFSAAVTFSLDTSGPRAAITISVGRAYLDEAVYPAYVGPSIVDFPIGVPSAQETFASARYPNANFNAYARPEAPGDYELWQGRQPGTRNDSAAYVRFPGLADALGDADVASADLALFPYWQATHGDATTTTVGLIGEAWDPAALSWNTQPAEVLPLGELDTSEGQQARLDVTPYVAAVVGDGAPDYGLQLSAAGPGASNWKRILDTAGFEPRLVVAWSGLRPSAIPAILDSADGAILAWTQPAVAPATVRFEVQVSADSFASTTFDSGVVKGSAGKASSYSLAGRSLRSGYLWRVRTRYADGTWSAWSTPAPVSLASSAQPTRVGGGAGSGPLVE
jgi:hypothetical protein